MTITLASDNFTRANNTTSWGTASDGEVWSRVVGSAALSIVSNQGKVTGSPAGTTYILLGTQTYLNGDVSHRFTTNTAGSSNMGIIVRYVDINNYVRIAIVNGTTLRVDIVFGGVLSILSPTATVSISANTAYRLHVNMSGAAYFVNLWLDGTTEPTSHTLQATDPNARFTLKGGLCGIYAGPGTALILLFDSYLVSAVPQTVYVATTGNDSNPGTLVSPWLTLQHACNLITPGSTVNVAPGTYAQPNAVQLTNYISGIATQRTKFISTTRLGAKVTGTGTTSVWDNEGDYVDFIRFEITTSDTSVREGILNNASNCSYQQCSAHDIKAVGGYPHGGAGLNHGGNSATNNDVFSCIVY